MHKSCIYTLKMNIVYNSWIVYKNSRIPEGDYKCSLRGGVTPTSTRQVKKDPRIGWSKFEKFRKNKKDPTGVVGSCMALPKLKIYSRIGTIVSLKMVELFSKNALIDP